MKSREQRRASNDADKIAENGSDDIRYSDHVE